MSHVVINKECCRACYLCINECPKKLIKIGEELNDMGAKIVEFDGKEGCIGCAMCAIRCPSLAITEVYKG